MGQRSRIIGAFAAVALGLLGSVLGGCQEGEKYLYKSTPHVPETVTLINTTTGEQVWSYDIPAGQELTKGFMNRESRTNELGYDEMTWTVGKSGDTTPPPTNKMRVPPPDSRRMDITVRPGPELRTGEQGRLPENSPHPETPATTPIKEQR